MVSKIVHILNGDALADRFPKEVTGELVIARECLVDGDVPNLPFEAFMKARAEFISQYPQSQCSAQQYLDSSVPEFEKIRQLTHNDEVNLWFEEDLFCQVNLWYVISLILNDTDIKTLALIRPNCGNEYNFSAMSNEELQNALISKQVLSASEMKLLAQCWENYQAHNYTGFDSLLTKLPNSLKFLQNAIEAELARQPDESGLGLPERTLLNIMKKIASAKNSSGNIQATKPCFSEVFQAFYPKMMVYSFGDLQVKCMYDDLLKRL